MGTEAGWYTRRKNKSEFEAALCAKAERYGEEKGLARLREYQRALLWCYGWMMNGMTAEFAKAIDDDEKYRKVKSLVGEASEEVEP